MASLAEIYALIEEHSGAPATKMRPGDDIGLAYGIDGDDFEDLVESFGEKFKVDLSGYKWYFHHGDEGFLNLGGLLIPPPNTRVVRIPVTPAMLQHVAEATKWDVDYPIHALPLRRYDLLINKIIFVAFAVGSLVIWIRRVSGA